MAPEKSLETNIVFEPTMELQTNMFRGNVFVVNCKHGLVKVYKQFFLSWRTNHLNSNRPSVRSLGVGLVLMCNGGSWQDII